MAARLEETAQWKEYAKLSPKQRVERIELVSQALVETYVQLDKDLLLLEESGLMVSIVCILCMLLMRWMWRSKLQVRVSVHRCFLRQG
jgi:hypothetical protein